MDDQPTRAAAATADMFDLIGAELLRLLRRRARRGDLRPPEPGRPRAPQPARRPAAGVPDGPLATRPCGVAGAAENGIKRRAVG
jgi:hypothetical protein